MPNKIPLTRLFTGVRDFDAITYGGLPKDSLTVLGGSPGSGKTTMALQFCYHNATEENPALIFNTLSEPTAKSLKYLQAFDFYSAEKLGKSIFYYDLGDIIRSNGFEKAVDMIKEQTKKIKPAFVVVDSFRVFEDLAATNESLRKFTYEVAVFLMAWECTGFLIGEYSHEDLQTKPLASIVDNIIVLSSRFGAKARTFQIVKMRGTDHGPDPYSMSISQKGVEIFASNITLKRLENDDKKPMNRVSIGNAGLDRLLGGGLLVGSTTMVSGPASSGKTLLSLEFIYKAAKEQNEKCLYISFEETAKQLIQSGANMGWDLPTQVEKSKVHFLYISPTEILVDKDLARIQEKIKEIGAKRVVVDSVPTFFYEVEGSNFIRKKLHQLVSIMQNSGATALFTSEIPYDSSQISFFGLEETLADGAIVLSSEIKNQNRLSYIEVFKQRNTAHLRGRFPMAITAKGIQIETLKGKKATRKTKRT